MPAKKEQVLWCGMSSLQKSYLQWILTRNFTLLNQGLKGSSKRRLMNVAMECRKACNHPYLFPNAEPQRKNSEDPEENQKIDLQVPACSARSDTLAQREVFCALKLPLECATGT